MQRRNFLKTLGAGAAGVAAAPFVSTAKAQETITWDMVTSWPKNFPALGTGANEFAQRIETLSGGRMRIRVHGAGELVPAMEVFDAVAAGTAEMGHSASYYWRGKVAASQFFTAVPFGMNTTETNGWLYHGGGQELWDEVYAKHNLKPFAVGNTTAQPGGWFKKEINSLADLQGLRLRLPGLAGEAMNRIGVTTVNMPGSEIFTSMQTGVLDAADWVSPYNDLAFGLHQVADYYYTSAWNEPSAVLEGTINLDAWNALPDDLKAVVRGGQVGQPLHDQRVHLPQRPGAGDPGRGARRRAAYLPGGRDGRPLRGLPGGDCRTGGERSGLRQGLRVLSGLPEAGAPF